MLAFLCCSEFIKVIGGSTGHGGFLLLMLVCILKVVSLAIRFHFDSDFILGMWFYHLTAATVSVKKAAVSLTRCSMKDGVCFPVAVSSDCSHHLVTYFMIMCVDAYSLSCLQCSLSSIPCTISGNTIANLLTFSPCQIHLLQLWLSHFFFYYLGSKISTGH